MKNLFGLLIIGLLSVIVFTGCDELFPPVVIKGRVVRSRTDLTPAAGVKIYLRTVESVGRAQFKRITADANGYFSVEMARDSENPYKITYSTDTGWATNGPSFSLTKSIDLGTLYQTQSALIKYTLDTIGLTSKVVFPVSFFVQDPQRSLFTANDWQQLVAQRTLTLIEQDIGQNMTIPSMRLKTSFVARFRLSAASTSDSIITLVAPKGLICTPEVQELTFKLYRR